MQQLFGIKTASHNLPIMRFLWKRTELRFIKRELKSFKTEMEVSNDYWRGPHGLRLFPG